MNRPPGLQNISGGGGTQSAPPPSGFIPGGGGTQLEAVLNPPPISKSLPSLDMNAITLTSFMQPLDMNETRSLALSLVRGRYSTRLHIPGDEDGLLGRRLYPGLGPRPPAAPGLPPGDGSLSALQVVPVPAGTALRHSWWRPRPFGGPAPTLLVGDGTHSVSSWACPHRILP